MDSDRRKFLKSIGAISGAAALGSLTGAKTLAQQVERFSNAVGRQANTDLLNVPAAGLFVDSRGRVAVNEHFPTDVPHIYAAGECIGFPALASTSMEQGRLAVRHMFQLPDSRKMSLFPYGIYTIPEISMIGKTERELTEQKRPYEVGVARYDEIAKGLMAGG
jgi:NAD(P) transhydrogenase